MAGFETLTFATDLILVDFSSERNVVVDKKHCSDCGMFATETESESVVGALWVGAGRQEERSEERGVKEEKYKEQRRRRTA